MNYSTSDYLEQLQQDREDLVDNLETKGITGLTGDETFTELVPEVLNIPSGGSTEATEKDVNFYDYDGTILYSYTKSEFLNLSAMPDNPSHDGLTSLGWNWDYEDAIDFVTEYGMLEIGQYYEPTDGKTKIYIELDEGNLSPYLGFAVNGTATIEWGDGTSDTVTGTSTSTVISTQHNYANAGKYEIKISSTSRIYFLTNGVGYTRTLWDNVGESVYNLAIRNVVLGNCYLGSDAFTKCYLLETIIISPDVSFTDSGAYGIVSDCRNLKHLTFAKTTTTKTLNAYFFGYCGIKSMSMPKSLGFGGYTNQLSSLKRLILPVQNTNQYSVQKASGMNLQYFIDASSVAHASYGASSKVLKVVKLSNAISSFNSGAFSGAWRLSNLKIPKSITDIPSNCFNGCSSMQYYDFSEHEAVPTLSNTNAFTGIPSDCKIIVPDDLYEDWIVASNWSTYSSYIIKKTDWDNL